MKSLERTVKKTLPLGGVFLLVAILASCCKLYEPEPTPTPTPPKKLHIAWEVKTNSFGSRQVEPLVVNDTLLFFNGSPSLTAVNTKTKEVETYGNTPNGLNIDAWKFSFIKETSKLMVPHYYRDNELSLNKTYLMSYDFDQQTFNPDIVPEIDVGRRQILYSQGWYYSPWFAAGIVKFNLNGEFVHRRYEYVTAGGVAIWGNTLFAAAGKTINGGLTVGRMYALDAETLDSLWTFELAKGTFEQTPPQVENGVLYAGTTFGFPSHFFAIDAVTGLLKWKSSEPTRTYFFTIENDGIYINGSDQVVKLNKATGLMVWKVPIVGTGYQNLVVKDGYVYHVRDGYIMVIEAETGKVLTRQGVPDGSYFWHIAKNSEFIFAQSSYHMVAYHPWGYEPKE
jgi:hypothetical protein